ncbi:MAG: type II toxin-antitoxin system PemK/MazF family toxin [Spirochaetota bacterium]
MTAEQGDVWWADLEFPGGSGPGLRRPVVVVQGDPVNRSRISTVICVALTSNLAWETAPGNVLLRTAETGLPRDSIANVSQLVTLDRTDLTERTGKLPQAALDRVLTGIDVVLDRR